MQLRKSNKIFSLVLLAVAILAVGFFVNDLYANGFARVLREGTHVIIAGETVKIPHKSLAVLRKYYIPSVEGDQWPIYKNELRIIDEATNDAGTTIYLNEYFHERDFEREKNDVELSSTGRVQLKHFFVKNEQAYVSYGKYATILNVFYKNKTEYGKMQVWIRLNHASSKQIKTVVFRQLGK